MVVTNLLAQIKNLTTLDFSGKGESFVESNFLTPLLQCLGYESHKDYEVRRHGDNGTTFKLRYPPVEQGADKVKHYNPDYIPTIRKKVFWIIEAKSAKDIDFPFAYKFVVQGLQYCIHPEIQAKYLIISNGLHTAIYDSHGAVFLGRDNFEPIMTFKNSELLDRWSDIYERLSVETLRKRIEDDIKEMYDKLCLSSLDNRYPDRLIQTIGRSRRELSQKIEREVIRRKVNALERTHQSWQSKLLELSSDDLYKLMDLPPVPGKCEGLHFSERCITEGQDLEKVLDRLTSDFAVQSIFRKEQSFVSVCILYKKSPGTETRNRAKAFLDQHKEGKLSTLNIAECALLRLNRKLLIIRAYPKLREDIRKGLESAPEIVKFVHPPNVLDYTFEQELFAHQKIFNVLKSIPETTLKKGIPIIEKLESFLEEEFRQASSMLTDSEIQLCGFEHYGKGGIHLSFRNILHNLGIEKRDDLG
jgi:hypothetical protein